MARRLERAARAARLDADAARIGRLFRAVLDRRATGFDDPHHPDYLHPARTALILLEDVRRHDPDLTLAATAIDTERPDLDLPLDEVEREAGARAAAIVDAIRGGPPPDAERLEWLVQLENDALLVALAERLDHARHLHLAPADRWPGFHRRFAEADLLAASRSDERLAWRMQRWHDSFARRFLDRNR
ncbi:MAG: hypothetical protein PVH00_05945 [Gemmatimonadota bacterium]